MRLVVKRVWNQLGQLEAALTDAKAMTLAEGQSISQEITLIETQVAKLKQERDERAQKLISEKYSKETERLSMGEFVLTRILNCDAEIKTIWMLGRFRRDPTENQVIMILRKTEFPEASMHELFPTLKEGGKRQTISSEQYFHNNEWRKFWFDMPKDLSKVQCDVVYPAADYIIKKYTR